MSLEEAIAFCRRRITTALEREESLEDACEVLRNESTAAERVWADSAARELRGRDLQPHEAATSRQRLALRTAIQEAEAVVHALERIGHLEATARQAIDVARSAAQSADVGAQEARRATDRAKHDVNQAAREAEAAAAALAGI